MDVLKELPADIREQIEKEMAAQRAKGKARVDTMRNQADNTSTGSTAATRTPQSDEPIVALPSLSQVMVVTPIDKISPVPRVRVNVNPI